MSGRQNLLVKIQVVCGLDGGAECLAGAAMGDRRCGTGEALTVAVTNLWFLVGVRRELKFYPYKRSFLRLAPPLAASVAILVWLHSRFPVQPAWLGIALALPSAYAVFLGSPRFGPSTRMTGLLPALCGRAFVLRAKRRVSPVRRCFCPGGQL